MSAVFHSLLQFGATEVISEGLVESNNWYHETRTARHPEPSELCVFMVILFQGLGLRVLREDRTTGLKSDDAGRSLSAQIPLRMTASVRLLHSRGWSATFTA